MRILIIKFPQNVYIGIYQIEFNMHRLLILVGIALGLITCIQKNDNMETLELMKKEINLSSCPVLFDEKITGQSTPANGGWKMAGYMERTLATTQVWLFLKKIFQVMFLLSSMPQQ
jgi:hypothetical protein